MLQGRAGEQFDTFAFDVDLPRVDTSHEYFAFCVCFRAGADEEHWDSNDGHNYALTSCERQRLMDTRPETHAHAHLHQFDNKAHTDDAW